MRIKIFSLIAAWPAAISFAYAEDNSAETRSKWALHGYIEAYYLQDFNHPDNHRRPDFIYSFNRTDQPAINLALIKATFDNDRVRANLGLASGDYMRANYAAEPDALQHVYEANMGVKLSDQHALWLDVGVMPSHIGFESAVGAENWTLSRSLLADNSPYFETGAKVSYTTSDGKWMLAGLLLNGWQRIQRAEGNTTPSFGHQLTYRPNESVLLNSSSFIGNDKSDRERRMRYFHNFYGQFKLGEAWSLIAGFDVGAEQQARNSERYDTWLAPILIARYEHSQNLAFAARYEYYQDKHGVIVASDVPGGFRATGYSLNMDYRVDKRMMLRAELRKLTSPESLFMKDKGETADNNLMLLTSIAISF